MMRPSTKVLLELAAAGATASFSVSKRTLIVLLMSFRPWKTWMALAAASAFANFAVAMPRDRPVAGSRRISQLSKDPILRRYSSSCR